MMFPSSTEISLLVTLSFSPQIRVVLPVPMGYSFPIQNVFPFCSKRIIHCIGQVLVS